MYANRTATALILQLTLLLTASVACLARNNHEGDSLYLEEVLSTLITQAGDTSAGFWVSGFTDGDNQRLVIDSYRFLPNGPFVGTVREHSPDRSASMSGIDSALVIIGEYKKSRNNWFHPGKHAVVRLVALNEEFSIAYDGDTCKKVWVIAWGTRFTGSFYLIVNHPRASLQK